MVQIDRGLSVQQNYTRMENAKWFYMSLFELLQKKEEARSEDLFEIVKANKLLQINLFRQSDEHEVLIMQNSGDKMNEIT